MVLDPNLPTFEVQQRPGSIGTAVDVRERKSLEYRYAAYKEDDKLHLCGSSVNFLDPASEAHLATLTTLPPEKNGRLSLKAVELISPPTVVEMKNTGNLGWEWSFLWEQNRYCWKRENVSLLGAEKGYTLFAKPEDKKFREEYPVMMYSPSKRGQSLQILPYNLDRLDPPLEDKKGQEILALVTLLSFLDNLFSPSTLAQPPLDPRTVAHIRGDSEPSSPGLPVRDSPLEYSEGGSNRMAPVPPSPTMSTLPNEIIVMDETKFDQYSKQALALLLDKSLLYIALIAQHAAFAGPTMKLAEEIKRNWYRQHDEELKTFIPPPEAPQVKPPSPPPVPSGSSMSLFSRRKSYIPPPPPPSLRILIAREDLGLPNYAPKKPKERGKDYRPPINLDGNRSRKEEEEERTRLLRKEQDKVAKSKKRP